MIKKDRKQKLKKLDVLYIVHNPVDCLIIYFCVCFTVIRIVYDMIAKEAAVGNVYIIALIFTASMGLVMSAWAKRTFKRLEFESAL